jgi:hypothetical protein
MKQNEATQPKEPAMEPVEEPQIDAPTSNLAELIDALQSVDTNSPTAQLNATTISDNNGGRIELNGPMGIRKPIWRTRR